MGQQLGDGDAYELDMDVALMESTQVANKAKVGHRSAS